MKRLFSIAFTLTNFVATSLAEPVISEFMTDNVSTLLDDNGEFSDWVEVHNPSNKVIDLTDYYLTDNPDNLTKWRIPDTILAGRGFQVIFASGTDIAAEPAARPEPKTNEQRLIEAGVPEEFIDQIDARQMEQILRQINQQERRVTRGGFHDRTRPRGLAAPRANFKLTSDGEFLALVKPDGKTIAHAYQPKYPKQRADIAYGLAGPDMTLGSDVSALLTPTPGAPNSSALDGFVTPVRFSHVHGLVEEPFQLTLSCGTPEAVIRYTLNGDDPTVNNGLVYGEPIAIGKSHILRATAFRDRYKASPVTTQTYLFLNDVIRQSPDTLPDGWPNGSINNQQLDFGMDPQVVNEIHQPAEVIDALRALPSMSVVAPLDSLFGSERGIYVNAGARGREWERKASLELLPSPNGQGFQIDGGLRVRGGFSRQGRNPKHSMRFTFRKAYGKGKLSYPLFEDKGVHQFNHIDLRSSMNYAWALDGSNNNTLLRDVFARDTQRDMGQPHTRSRYYHLYLNGHYWGIYMTQERSEADYAASYLGGDKEDYDVIKTFGRVADGSNEAYQRLYELAVRGFTDNDAYFNVQGMNTDGTRNPEYERLVDIDNLIDFMLSEYYGGDKDGPGGTFSTGNNYYTIYNRKNPDGFKFFEHDSEHSLGLGLEDMTDYSQGGERGRPSRRSFNPHWLHERLAMNAHYQKYFTERAEKHFFDGGALSPEAVAKRIKSRAQQIEDAIIAHSARWGDAQRNTPMTRQHWLEGVAELKRFVTGRDEVVLRQLYERGWYTGLPKPLLNRPPGPISANFKLFVRESAGDAYVTTDGSDPRGSDGNPASSAKQFKTPRVESTPMLDPPYQASVWVPTHGRHDDIWNQSGFKDEDWIKQQTEGIGFDVKPEYRNLIDFDLLDSMHDITTTAYIRIPFQLSKGLVSQFDAFALKMKYDDGFIAYLNGKQIASDNAPDHPNWRSAAIADHADKKAVNYVSFSADIRMEDIKEGTNLLAVHGMDGPASSDFLISPSLEGVRFIGGDAIPLASGTTNTIKVRIFQDGKWSPLLTANYEVTP